MDGFIIIDKPSGITSHDVVSFIRRKLKMRRVGHAGTLDPLATGVLVVLLGQSTKLFDRFSSFDKAYEATLTLGTTTDTADTQGKVLNMLPYEDVTRERVESVFRTFLGDIEQVPPMVSAVKVQGKRLYKLARKGIEVVREPRQIRINRLELIDFSLPKVKFHLECSKGTYVRKIAEDVGAILGCGGCISQIRRLSVGPFDIKSAVSLEEVSERHILKWGEKGVGVL
ncbi:MAG TPA: tRNA pseudouridine(55) synthase TruB [Candidatus Omnitrophota bacterium]|nr:tRNA pseudouridine(55) synthase TruB [Candidatus Omnitrophota bacterium]HPD85093.1 tRNA pseudouridine(55) synthase TruB [Candidatus Omnitrophota bacterium]HRZ03951.1 tRNA pseudouridine(55) synthase TruB [Candidatus Omnitrophota bacterium]